MLPRRALLFAVLAAVCGGGVVFSLAGRHASADPPAPHMAIDADPTNGGRPCDPIDPTRTNAPSSRTYTVAICLVDSQGAPDAFEATVIWSGGAATAPEVSDAGDALDDNPDFNEGAAPAGFGTNWSCNGFGLGFPKAENPLTPGLTDAHISCNEKSFAAGTLASEPGLLATLTMQATGAGTETFAFSTADGSSSVNSPAGTNNLCVSQLACPGASVQQGTSGEATSTPTDTPTATATATPLPASAADPVLLFQANTCVWQLAAHPANPVNAPPLAHACRDPLYASASVSNADGTKAEHIDMIAAAASESDGVNNTFGNDNCDLDPSPDDIQELVCALDSRDGALDAHFTLLPSDFAALVAAGDQFHDQDGQLIAVAFVSNDRDTTFHAQMGFFDGTAFSATNSCRDNQRFDQDSGQIDLQPDADCDGDGVPGDGIAVAFLRARRIVNPDAPDPPHGPANLSVDHDGITTDATFIVVGEPQTVVIEDGEDAVATGAPAPCTQPDGDAAFAQALDDLDRTVLVARALDADGTSVVGAFLGVVSSDTQKLALAQGPSFFTTQAIGGDGIGLRTALCGGSHTGSVHVTVHIVPPGQALPEIPFNPESSYGSTDSKIKTYDILSPDVILTPTPTPTETPIGYPTPAPGCDDGFEQATPDSASIPCWTAVDHSDGTGGWCGQTGTSLPQGTCHGDSIDVPAPPEGQMAAMTNQSGPGSYLLYRCGVVASGTLSFQLYVNDRAGAFSTPNSLDHVGPPNQQFRADLVKASGMSDPFTLAPEDVLLNLYRTESGHPSTSGYSLVSRDVSAVVGQDVCLRFAEVSNQYYLHIGIDDVHDGFAAFTTPVPTSTLGPTSTPNPLPHLAIDADPTNGTRPCDPIDTSRSNAPTSGTYTVAICLVNSQGAPDAFEATVMWLGAVATALEVADAGDALDDNPDFNDAPPPTSNGSNWSCTDGGFAYPNGDVLSTSDITDAHIVCNTKSLMAGTLTAEPGLLATLTMDATGTGTETFDFVQPSSVNSPVRVRYVCGVQVACPGAWVQQGIPGGATSTPTEPPTPVPTDTAVPTATNTATSTPTTTAASTATDTPVPTATSTPVVSPTNTATPASAVAPHMAIDADPTNGSRPCDPIDATRTNAPTSGTYTVAICLVDSQGAPDAFGADVIWSGGVATALEVADSGDALDDNPDFNNGPAPTGFGSNWNCTSFGFFFPHGDDSSTLNVTDAHIVCNENSFTAGTLTAEPGLLATLRMNAHGGGTEVFAFSTDGTSSVNSPAGANHLCGLQVPCPGASVQQSASATSTPTPPSGITSTPTNTPVPTATNTPVPTATNTPGVTPTTGPPVPHMAIDADPTNGDRPCDPIDASRTGAPSSGSYTVAICLVDSQGAPDGFEATVLWSGAPAFAPDIADAGDALDDNPDFNDGPAPEGFGTNWSCTGFGFGYPAGGTSTAHISCNSKDFQPGTLTASPGLLATLTLNASGAGTETFAFTGDGASSVNSPAGANNICVWQVPCPGASVKQGGGTATPTPLGGGTSHLAIDADPSNGDRPCDPIDASRANGPASGSYTVAICLADGHGAPDAFEATVLWTGAPASAPEISDVGDALDDNPDFNNSPAPTGFGSNWSCNAFGFSYPSGGANSAHISCNEKSFAAGTLTAQPGLLATLTLNATGSATQLFMFSTDGSSSVNSPAGDNNLCGVEVACPGASVQQGDVIGTATPTNTPTITPTPVPAGADPVILLQENVCIWDLAAHALDSSTATNMFFACSQPLGSAPGIFNVQGLRVQNIELIAAAATQPNGVNDTFGSPFLCDEDPSPDDMQELVCSLDARDGALDGNFTLLPSDFAAIDAGGTQFHDKDGQVFAVAFLRNDRVDTIFRSTAGFFSGEDSSATHSCRNDDGFDQDSSRPGFQPDADCDGDGIAGDGVAVAFLRARYIIDQGVPLPPHGAATLSVDHDGFTTDAPFTVVGEPQTVEIEAPEDAVSTRAPGPCTMPDTDAGFSSALASLDQTVLVARALDADGTPVVGAFLTVESADTAKLIVPGLTFATGPIGADGVGLRTVLCGGAATGSADVKVRIIPGGEPLPGFGINPEVFAIEDSEIKTYTVMTPEEILALTPTVTPTTTATATETPTAIPTSTPTDTPTSVPTSTATSTATTTPVPADTATSTPADTATPVPTSSTTTAPTLTPVPPTASPNATKSPSPAATRTAVVTVTAVRTSRPVTTPSPRGRRTATATPSPHRCPDVNGDGVVDVRDLALVARHIGRRHGPSRFDVTGDDRVDWRDVLAVLRHSGRRC